MISTHICEKIGPNWPNSFKKKKSLEDFYNRLQQVAEIWKGFLKLSTFVSGL
jgi:hypothetical protein